VLVWATLKNPLLLRLAWRNVPRRPGFAALITLGLTIGTIILSSAFTTGDTMSQSVRTVVSGVLGSADEVVFIPALTQRSGFDLAQSIATGSLLTGVTSYFPADDTVHAFGLPGGAEATWRVQDVTRLGDLGGGQAAIFLPLDRLQSLLGRPDQVNQVLIVNAGDAAARLDSSWPITVKLRSAFV